MSENQIRGTGDLSYCDTMTTEELEEILRLDAEMPEGQESDTEKILYIMEVLAERKRNTRHTGNTALEAYESFKQNYMPETDNNTIPIRTRHRMPRWVRGLVATAAVLAILFTGSVTAKALGFNVWKAVIQWTQETFHFGDWGNSDPNSNLQFDSFQAALEEGNIPAWLVPTSIPDGFNLTDITVEQSPLKNTYRAIYINAEKDFVITVRDYLNGEPVYIEQSEGMVEEHQVSGITYYLFENNQQVHAVWIVDSYECYISGNLKIDELKTMINSIEEG